MKEYDEEKLLDKFAEEPFTRRFPIAKRRLYDMILKSLDAFHAESSVETRMRRSLHQVEILFKKGLYKDASKLLRSVRRTATERQMDTLLLDVKIWERRLMERSNYADLKDGQLHRAGIELDDILQRLTRNGKLWELKSELFHLLYQKGQARSTENVEKLNAVLQHELLSAAPADPRGKYLYHHILGAHAFACGELEKCKAELKIQLTLLTKENEHFLEEPYLVFAVLSNLIHVAKKLGEDRYVEQLLLQYRALPDTMKIEMTEDLSLRLFATTSSLELSLGIEQGRFSDLLNRMDEFKHGIDQFGERLGAVRKAGLYYSIAFTYFATGNMSDALKWCNRLLNDIRIDKSEDIICFGHLLNLLIHLEAGHTQLLPYALRSSERYLKTRKRVYQFEALFLNMVKALARAKTIEKRDRVLSEFIDSAVKLKGHALERPVYEHLHPIAWAKSKLAGTTLESALKDSSQAA
jgi:hypothetical protein